MSRAYWWKEWGIYAFFIHFQTFSVGISEKNGGWDKLMGWNLFKET